MITNNKPAIIEIKPMRIDSAPKDGPTFSSCTIREGTGNLPTSRILDKSIAEYFNVDKKELQTEFLSDQIAYKILDEEADIEILKVAEEKVKYLKTVNYGK